MVRRSKIAALLFVVGASGCGLVLGLEDGIVYSDAGVDAGPDAATPADALSGETDALDALSDGDGADPLDGASDAPPERGPRCIPVPHEISAPFCIDETEVTVHQYLAMLSDIRGDAGTPVATLNGYLAATGCDPLGAIADLYPNAGVPSDSDYPMTNVGWCQAFVFCKWAGKHMCGAVGGGPVDSTSGSQFSPTDDEWHVACSSHGLQAFPYGNVAACGACNENGDCDGGGSGVVAPKTFPTCVSEAGVYDLVGNVWEWENSYVLDAAVTNRYPLVRGGSFINDHQTDCFFQHGTDWSSAVKGDIYTGIRCCR